MYALRVSLPPSLAIVLLGCLLGSGCGIITAPYSVPEAISENADFSFKGTIVDLNGHPLDGAVLSQQLDHHFWEPISGGTEADERHLLHLGHTFSVLERGRQLHLLFTRDGYNDADYSFDASDAATVQTSCGSWPNNHNFPVVMIPRGPDATLATWDGVIDYTEYPRTNVVDLNRLATPGGAVGTLNVEEARAFSPGIFYMLLVKGGPLAAPANSEVNPADVDLPAHISLVIAGPDAGFIRIQPRLGYPPIQVSDAAPADGYTPEFTIDRKRLREMRLASSDRIIEAHEYFFFRANGRYGKGWIAWSQTVDRHDKKVLPLAFRYALWLQPNLGELDLANHTTGRSKDPG